MRAVLHIFFLLFFVGIASSQTDSTIIINHSQISINASEIDTTINKKKSKSGIDSIIQFSAKDTVRFLFKTKKMQMQGNAKLHYKTQKLNADYIEIDFNESTLSAEGRKDSSNKFIGFPSFMDNKENYVGSKVRFNFKTQRGNIVLGETEMSEGFYFGSKIKKISENELFVQDGCYTTCDAPHPHYYFGSPEMKVVSNDRVFLDPIVFYVEDLPVFIVPFGLFFPSQGGRQSGIMIPSFFFSKSRGTVIENFGLFLNLSEYYDTQFLVDFYSKGGYMLKNKSRWKLLNYYDGYFNLDYGKVRFDPDDNYSTNWSFQLSHNHNISPQDKIVAYLNFSSQNYNKNTSTNIYERIQQDITSNASYTSSFDDGTSFFVSYSRNQNIINNTYNQSGQVTYSIPQMFPLKSLFAQKNWLSDISFTYRANANWNEAKTMTTSPDTSYHIKAQRKITHSPSISISPKLGYFTITPSLNFNANNYFRKVKKQFNPEDSSITESYENGFFTEYNFSAAVSLSTRLYGIVNPKIWGINSIRHTFQPTFSFSWTPDLSDKKFGFYDSYYDEKYNQDVMYSVYELDGGGIASRQRSQSLSYSFLNSFEAKVAQDTAADKVVELLRFTLGGSYNFVADSLKFSDLNLSFRTPSILNMNMNGAAGFTLYDQDKRNAGQTNETYSKVNRFLISEGKGLARLTNFSLQLSTTFSSAGSSDNTTFGKDVKDTTKKEEAGLGDRFTKRMEYSSDERDLYGDNSPGYSNVNIPWNLSFGLNFQYSRYLMNNIQRNLTANASFSFNLTKTWAFQTSASYDFIDNEFLTPVITVTKDLHCWQLYFQWYPIGYSQGFYLKFSIKAPQLQDMKIEKRNNPMVR
ncbi:MAG TPA: putative LPS assembly protein LptD [Candidatus Kapabacteria bacterium]|nr:putative LPS assembly protein LptD [Candidatus Kapabacteria bacterium]HPO63685.1 putative LPS assembly protein LptD [Candidatus Kapabacteria bacterium]